MMIFFVYEFQNQTKILLTISDMILSEKCGKFEIHGLHFWAVRIILENSSIQI